MSEYQIEKNFQRVPFNSGGDRTVEGLPRFPYIRFSNPIGVTAQLDQLRDGGGGKLPIYISTTEIAIPVLANGADTDEIMVRNPLTGVIKYIAQPDFDSFVSGNVANGKGTLKVQGANGLTATLQPVVDSNTIPNTSPLQLSTGAVLINGLISIITLPAAAGSGEEIVVVNTTTGQLKRSATAGAGLQNRFTVGYVSAGVQANALADIDGYYRVTSGVITASRPAYQVTQTWNNAGVVFNVVDVNITDTASNNSSKFLDCKTSGFTRASINKNGTVVTSGGTGSTTVPSIILANTGLSYNIHSYDEFLGSRSSFYLGVGNPNTDSFPTLSTTQLYKYNIGINITGQSAGATLALNHRVVDSNFGYAGGNNVLRIVGNANWANYNLAGNPNLFAINVERLSVAVNTPAANGASIYMALGHGSNQTAGDSNGSHGGDFTIDFGTGGNAFGSNKNGGNGGSFILKTNIGGTATGSGIAGKQSMFIISNQASTASGLVNAANDAAALAAGVPIGGLYRNGSVVQTRVV